MRERSSSGSGVAWMLASVVFFNVANLLVKDLPHVPTQQLVFLRSAFSLVVIAAYLRAKGLPFWGHNRPWLLIRGVSGVISLTAFFHTLKHIPLASATVIQYTSPIFTVLLAGHFLGQTVQRIQWLFLALAFTGVLMVKGFDPAVSWGMWGLGLVSAGFAAISYVATTKCRDTDPPAGIVLWFHLIGVPVMGTWSGLTWVPLSGSDWMGALGIASLSVLAQVWMSIALHREDAGRIMPLKYVGALLAALFGYALFDEVLRPGALLGMALVILALTANTWVSRQRA
jgi:drug/metabolite transporter (DMT)-like permease